MTRGAPAAHPRRLALGVLALLLAAAVAGALAGLLGSTSATALSTDVPTVRRLLTERLDERNLTYRYVVCVRSPARFRDGPVVRCNVNFNAPHIEVYCGVVAAGELLTDHDSAAVPCPRDDVGVDPPVRVHGG